MTEAAVEAVAVNVVAAHELPTPLPVEKPCCETTNGITLLDEKDPALPVNSDDIFTLDELRDPIVKIRYATGMVFGFSLEGLSVWLRKHKTDPLLRTARFSEEQIATILKRQDLHAFATNQVLSTELVQLVLSTCGQDEQLQAIFAQLDARQLCSCLFAAHRLSFLIFQEAWIAGHARGIVDVTTLELFLYDCLTNLQPHHHSQQEAFAKQLLAFFTNQIEAMGSQAKKKLKIRHALGHMVIHPRIRGRFLDALLRHAYLIPRPYLRHMSDHPKTPHSTWSSCVVFCNLYLKA